MKAEILTLPDLHLVGLEARFISARSRDANNLKVIPPLWKALMARQTELGVLVEPYAYGACMCLPEAERHHPDELVYLAAFNVSPAMPTPYGFVDWCVPGQTYARFIHRGSLHRLSETIGGIYGGWLPGSGFERAPGPDLERYGDRFCEGKAESELELFVPVRAKSAD